MCALYMEMGLGKTSTCLYAVRDLYTSVDVTRVLVVGPKRVAAHTWPTEIEKWGISIPVVQLCGMSFYRRVRARSGYQYQVNKETAEKIDQGPGIYLINYEVLQWLVEACGNHWPFDMVVLDESTRMKKPSAKRVRAIRRVLPQISRMVLLSGSPSPNGLKDLWSPHFLLDRGARLGATYTGFIDRWFTQRWGSRFSIMPTEAAHREIPERIKDITVSMKAQDYLELPPIVKRNILVELPENVRHHYVQMERDFLTSIQEEDVTAANAAVKTSKLLQISNGAVYDEDRNWHHMHDAKLDALEDLIEESAGAPILLAYQYQHDLERIRKRFKQAKILDKQNKAITQWNKGEIELLCVHPASAGHGLNLQAGGNIVCWFGGTWNLEHYDQTNARLYRQGQTRPTFVYHILAEGTMDLDVLERTRSKKSVQDILMAKLKRRKT